MKVEITDVAAVDFGDSVRIKVEITSNDNVDKRQFLISSEQYYELGMLRPCIISEDIFDKISEMSEIYSCIRKGSELLSYAVSNKSTLVRKLRVRGYSNENAALAVEYLSDKGYIDEVSQAEKLILRYAQKNLYGKRRIAAELFSKGYSKETVNEAFENVSSDIDFDDNKKKLVKIKFAGQDISDFSVKQKVYSLLKRYGY